MSSFCIGLEKVYYDRVVGCPVALPFVYEAIATNVCWSLGGENTVGNGLSALKGPTGGNTHRHWVGGTIWGPRWSTFSNNASFLIGVRLLSPLFSFRI